MISCWGSSETMGVDGIVGYVTQLSELLDLPVYNGGMSGENSTQITDRFLQSPSRWDDTTIVWMGRINYHELDRVLDDHRRLTERVAGRRFLVCSGQNITPYRGGPEMCLRLNEALARLAGPNWFDWRSRLVREGLAVAGIEPTDQDLADIENEIVPSSLRCDHIHQNTAGNRVIARWLAEEITSRGWLTASAQQAA